MVPNTPASPISSTQAPNTPRPFTSIPMTDNPQSFNNPSTSVSGFEHNAQNRIFPGTPSHFGQAPHQARGVSRADVLSPRSVPHRPQSASQFGYSADSFTPELPRTQNAPHPSRLVTDPSARDGQRPQMQRAPSFQQSNSSSIRSGIRPQAQGSDTRQLGPGTILRNGRYRLLELQERQEWLAGAYESMWIAQDAQRGASQVMICELVLPGTGSVVMQSTLRTATIALTSVGRHPHIPTLWDAFSDRGRNFFVFEPFEGESLLNRMRRTGRAMPEQDVIECCLQMTEVLELLAQHSPPLVHGLIRPEHILVVRTGSQYVLTNFSIVLAGGATQFVSGMERTRLSVHTAPEFVRGVIDVRSDLFALMATAYHAVTGSMPTGVSGSIPQAQRLNPNVSPQFDAILARGLRPIASQRYQRASELRQDLLAMRSVSGTLVPGQRLEQPFQRVSDGAQIGQKFEQSTTPRVADSVAQALQSLAPADNFEEQKLLLPRPEELPPLEERNDRLYAALWLSAILVCLVLVIVFSRGFV
ncbi:MAG TPA: protein kinase [Ktedonobacteraceae bacterium]|nr:protein kinase [Ktedonobacteraceae bacterium]